MSLSQILISVFVIVVVILVQVTVVRAHLILRICGYIFNDLRHIRFIKFLLRYNVNTPASVEHHGQNL